MNDQTFANVRLNRNKVQLALLIRSCLPGLILLAQSRTHSQVGEEPQQGRSATSAGGVTASSLNPLQRAVLDWYDANLTPTFHMKDGPEGLPFDGANIWLTNSHGDAATKQRASGAVLGTFSVGKNTHGVPSDGANIWVSNYSTTKVAKLRAGDGYFRGTFSGAIRPFGLALDDANTWVANTGSDRVSKM